VDWLNARLTLIFGLILVVFLLSFAVSWYAFSIQRQLDDQKVLLREDADGVLRTMIDQENRLQGYISSNNQGSLDAFNEGRPIYLTFVQDLTTQLQSGPFRHTAARLTTVEEVADEWYSNYARAQIDEMQAGKFAGPRSETSIDQGNALFDQFRAAVTLLQEAIGQDLEGYQNQVDTINLSLVIGIIVLLLGANAAFLWILRNFTGTLQTQLVGLTRTTERLGQGEQTARVDPLTFTDLDQVGQSINSMADAIQQHQVAAEAAMHALEHQYALVERAQSESRAIFDASSEAFLFISASGQVHALNRPFREFFALAAEEIVGIPFANLQRQWEPLFVNAASFHADLAQDHANQERRYMTTAIQKNPQYRELAVFSTPVQSSTAAYLGRLYVLRDITREREAERLKAEFYALVSHGLRTPLTSIKGYTDLLAQQEETGPLTELQQEFVGIVQSNARRLLALVNDLLDLSRLEAQTLAIRTVPLDLHSLIRDVTQSMRPQIEERRQRLSLHLADSPLIVLGDENRVGQILTNLLTFATIHTPVGGRIDWETETLDVLVRITCFSSGDLSAEDLAAFDRPFFHGSALSPSETGGSMLGPSITRSLVVLHGGTLQISSGAGVGTTLTCTLLLSPPQALTGEDATIAHAGDQS
jgi:PAS domain S-box-containing protein